MHLKMEQQGVRSEFAEQLRAAYRERVAQRLARTASATAEVPATPATRDLAEVRRQAREAWLQLRSQAPPGVSRAPARAAEPPARQAEDDLAL
jgi:hypothetical protein